MVTADLDRTLTPNKEFARLAGDEQIQRTVRALEAHGIHALVAENGEEARRMFFEIVPEGAEAFLGASMTLEKLGIRDEIDKSGRFDALRPKMFAMDRKTQGREIRKLVGAPDFAAGSVHAVTENGKFLKFSLTDDCVENRQPAWAVCFRRGPGRLGGRRPEDRQGFE